MKIGYYAFACFAVEALQMKGPNGEKLSVQGEYSKIFKNLKRL